ncbi:MAG: hypothetical protein U0T84_13090 [Chitinophagales bacterium]
MKKYIIALLMCAGAITSWAQGESRKMLNDFQTGDIVASTTARLDGQFYKPSTAGDMNIIGVFGEMNSPRIDRVMITSGVAQVKTAEPLRKGDWVTTNAKGEAVKATSGMMLGVVLEDAAAGTAKIRIMITYK